MVLRATASVSSPQPHASLFCFWGWVSRLLNLLREKSRVFRVQPTRSAEGLTKMRLCRFAFGWLTGGARGTALRCHDRWRPCA